MEEDRLRPHPIDNKPEYKVSWEVYSKLAPNLYYRVGNSDAFRKLRIFESDGYTLILRSHFALIDEIRGTVIISKTPTNILKKDIELIIRLLSGE